MNHRGGSRAGISPGWWLLLALVSCGLLIGSSPPPACESGGPCGPEAYFQQTIYWEDENSVCGDGWCDLTEGVWNCPADCSECGDGVCRPDEVDTCPGDCPVTVTCGDGICSHYENSEACPADCQGITPTVESPPTSTPRPTSSGGSGGGQNATPRPTKTPTPTPEEEVEEQEEEAEEAEEVTEEVEPTATDTQEPEVETICEEVDANDLPDDLADTFNEYYDFGPSHLFATCKSVPKEVCVALDPAVDIPDAILNVPGRILLRQETQSDISIDDLGVVDLTYCITGGDCISYAPTSFDQATNLICFGVGDQELVPVCTNGCTFGLFKRSAPKAGASPTPEGGSQMDVSPLVIVILLGVLILAVIALIIFLVLANRPNRT